MKKFLLIDDHTVVRSGIKNLLTELYKYCEIHEADNDVIALEQLKTNTYDMLLMDVQIPKADMVGLMEFIHIKYPDTKVLIFSMSPEKIYAKRFLKIGARGFLSKEASLDEITKAFSLVLSDRKYISESLAESLAGGADNHSNIFDKLSIREFEVVSLLLSGLTIIDISQALNLQSSTVGTHKARAFEKLGVTGLLELKDLAMSYNLQ
jgi:two-component system invasion response regulator UvrY